ncbi:MAG TPA: (2Fe-2S)-binding protein [Polyangia bacterium]|nr:(2Fe-2S)-binding protein [Polyangia bacterium]
MRLRVNGSEHTLDIDASTPLLWALRDNIGLCGTKFGCGVGLCGACSVMLGGQLVRSCVTPISAAEGRDVVTIEGLSPDSSHPLQKAWVAEEVPQCGYCQSGQLMAASALLAQHPDPTDEQIDAAMTNVCRCGTYQRVRTAIHRAARAGKGGGR